MRRTAYFSRLTSSSTDPAEARGWARQFTLSTRTASDHASRRASRCAVARCVRRVVLADIFRFDEVPSSNSLNLRTRLRRDSLASRQLGNGFLVHRIFGGITDGRTSAQGQLNNEGRSDADLALRSNVAAVAFDDAMNYRKSQGRPLSN